MTSAIAWVMSNAFVVLFVVAVFTALRRIRRLQIAPLGRSAAYVAWGEILFYAVGLWSVYTGILHAYFQPVVAPSIGWQPSPFEYELGWMEIPLGVVALMALWRGYEFRLAATIVAVTFAFAAAAQHVQEMICCANYAPSNAGLVLWFADIFVPAVLVALAILSTARDSG